tara:strand:- start:77201 stop:77641 length:441 start_codon:yes stop_codon:yes gene_type:complete
LTSLRNFLENKGFVRVPLSKLQTGHYQVTLYINDNKGSFILDTGASTSCIGFQDVSTFNLLSEETEIKAAGAGATNMETMISKNNSLRMNLLTLQKVDFVLFNMEHVNNALNQAGENSVHGILGADLLKKLRTVIDYGRNCAYFKK